MNEIDSQKAALGIRLKTAREMAGLSQGQVAKEMGLHRPSISEMEAGRRNVSTNELTRLAELYQVDLTWLASGKEEESIRESRVDLAARELSKLSDEDLERVMTLLSALKG